jgi:hypothetical protein
MARSVFVSKLSFRSWIKGLAREKRKLNSRKQRSRSSPLWLEELESRLAPATVSNPAGNLQFVLDPGETLTFTATSTPGTYQVTTTTAFTPTSATGFTSTGNVGTITSGGLSNITIIDATPQSSESIVFADSSANAYSTAFIINLANDVACDSVRFDGTSTFSSPGGLAATVANGNIVCSDTSSLLTTSGAPLRLTATAGNIDLLGTVNVSGAASFTAGGFINVNNPNNGLALVSFNAVGDVSLQTANAMAIGTSSITGSGILTVTAGGNITQTGIITTPNLATFDSTGGSVTLTLNNAFSGGVGGSGTGTNTFSLTNAGAFNLADITLGTGALAVTAGGTISELAAVNGIHAGIPSGVGGGATFTLTAAGSILLDTAPNNFAGGLVTYAGGANVINQALRDVSPLASVAGASFTGNLNSTTTVSNVSSFIDLAVGQPITGTGIPANTTIQALDTVKKTITLSQAATATTTGVALTTPSTFSFGAPPSGSFLKIIYDDAPIVMPAVTIGGATGTISLTSGGDILQTGALSASFGVFTLLRGGSIDLTIAGGNTIGLVSLNDPNADATSAVSYTGSAGVTLGNSNLGLGTFSINASNGNITQADVTFTGSTTTGSVLVTGVTDIAALAIGQTITRTGGPQAIAAGTTIVAINEVTGTITLSQTATRTVAGATLVAMDTITQKRGAAAGTTFTANTTASSTLLANVSTLIALAVGQTITGPGIPTGTTISAITPSFSFTGNTTNGSTSITNVSSTAGLVVGQVVSGPGIPANAIIKSIVGNTVTISAAATATATGITVTVSQTVTLSQAAAAAGTGVTLTRVGALTFNVVAGGNTVNLTPATAGFHNDFEGAIAVTGAGVTIFGLDNASTLANLLPQGATNPPNFLSLPSTVTDLGTIGINFTNTLALLPNWTTLLPALASLTVNAQGIYQLQGTNVTGNTTNGSKTVTNLSATTGLAVGQSISGPGIPAGTTITAINTTTKSLTLSQAATATGTAVTLTNGTGITVTGVAFFNAGNFPILLNNPNNLFGSTAGNGIVLRNSGPNAVVVDQTASAVLNFDGGNTVLGNGTFTVNAPGGISQDLSNSGFRITQAANAGQTLFNTADGAISGSINLNNPGGGNNNFTGITSFNAPQPGFKGTTTSGSPNVTNVSSLAGLSIGQTVTGPGIPIGTTINGFIGTSTVVLNNAATASASGVNLLAGPTGDVNVNAAGTLTLGTSQIGGAFTATGNGGGGGTITQNPGTTLTVGGQSSINFGTVLFNNLGNVFEPGINFTGTTSVGSTTVSNVSNISGIVAGQTVTGPGIPVNTTIVSINPAGSIVLSQAATAAGTVSLNATSAGGAITFSGSTSVTVRDSKTTGLVLAATALPAPPPPTFLTVFASGPITQAGPLTNITTATFVASTSAIILTDPGNDFLGSVNLISTGSAPVAVNDTNGIQLGTVQLGTGSLAINAGATAGPTNDITQTPFAVGPATTFGVAGVPGIGITGGITETGPSTVSFTGSTTNGSANVSNVLLSAGMFGLAVGESVTGPGIPAGTTITAINVATNTITLSQNATATASGIGLTATGMVFSTALAGATVNLNAFNNDILTPINANTTNLTVVNQADINLSATTIAAGGNLNATSTGIVTLPTALPANFGAFTSSAKQTNIVANLTATSFTFNGTANFATTTFTGTTTNGSANVTVTSTTGLVVGQNVTGPGIPAGTTIFSIAGTTVTLSQNATASATVTLTATPASLTATTGNITFDGNVQVAGPLNLILPTNNASVNLLGGTWGQGSNNLTITQSGTNTNNFNIGGAGASAVFNMSGGTIQFTGSTATAPGNVVVGSFGTFEVGANTPSTTFNGTTSNGSAIVTNVSSALGLTIGQTVAGTGIPAGTTIVAIGTTTITLSQNATASNAGITITPLGQAVTVDNTGGGIQFLAGSTLEVGMSNVGVGFTDSLIKKAGATGNITIQPGARLIGVALNGNGLAPGTDFTGTATSGSTTETGLTSVAGLAVGQTVTGPGIASGTTIAAIGASSITLSQAATASGTKVLLTAGAGTVLYAAGGIITGFFDRTVDVNNSNAAHAFLMGSDIAMPDYNCGILSVVAGSGADAGVTMTNTTGGVFTTFNTDGDKFTVTASGGSAAGLVVVKDVNGDLGIVYRNSLAGNNTLTMTTSATPGSGFTTNIAGISVDGPGAITISASTVDLGDPTLGIGGEIRVQNLLTSLTLHNADNFQPVITFTGNVTNGSATITNVTNLSKLVVGETVTGAGIPAGTTITAIGTAFITLSAAATANGTTVSLSATNANNLEPYNALILAGGTTTGLTAITGNLFANVDMDLSSVLNALTVKQYTMDSGVTSQTIEAERFGTITVAGIPGLLVSGDLNATLINHNAANSATAAISTANISGTLSGYWDLAGSVGSVTAKKTTLWDFGQALEQTFTARTITGSRTLTTISSPTGLVVGQVVTGAGIQAGTTITGITGSTITLSQPATASAGGVTITALSGSSALPEARREPPVQKAIANPLTNVTSLSLGVTALSDIDATGNIATLSSTSWNTQVAFTGNTVRGSSVISNVSDVADLLVGEIVTGAGIPANSAIIAITSSTITLNTAATATAAGVALTATPSNASDTVQVKSFGTVTTTGNTSIGDIGDMVNVNLIATGNNAGNALSTMTIAGNLDARVNNLTNLVFNNGNVGAITVARTVGATGSVNITDDTSATSGAITTIQAAAWGGSTASTIAAKSVATINITGSSILLGNFVGSVFLQGTANATSNTLTSFHASNNVSNSTFIVQNGAVGTFTVGITMATTTISVLGGAGGTVGTISAAQWNTGTLVALSIGTLKTTGLVLPNPSGAFIPGNVSLVGMNFFRNNGKTPAVGTLSVAGSLILTNLTIRADNGITTFTVGRDVQGNASSIIHVDNSLAGTPTVGQIVTLTAGRWGTSGPSGSAAPAAPVAISANSLGTVNIKGYTAPELGTANFFPGEFDNSTVYIRGNLVTGPGITSFTANGNMVADTIDVVNGIATITVARQVNGTLFREENPLLASSGQITTLSAGEIVGSSIQANSIGTLKTTANLALFPYYGLEGNFNTSDVTITALTGTGLAMFSVAGDMASSTMNIRASLTSFTVSQTLSSPFLVNGSRVPGDSIAAGFSANGSIGTLTAANIDGLDLVTNSLTTLNVKGNTTAGLAGSIANSLFTVIGNSGGAKTGIGTIIATGTVSHTGFNVFNGNVGSVTVGAFTSSALLVGFHAVAANDITEDPVNSAWNPANFSLNSFMTTGPVVTPTSPALAGTFTDSLIVAAKLGTITLPGINTILPAGSPTITFGVGFRKSTGGSGTATIEGSVRAPGFSKNNVFFYRGLVG